MEEHDHRWSFLGPYLVLSVVLSVFVSLFWLLALIGMHAALEWTRQRRLHPNPRWVAGRILWELKLDLALLLFALVIVVYTDVVLGLLGLGAAARAGTAGAARIVAWQRGIRGFLMTVDEMMIAWSGTRRILERQKNGEDDGEPEEDGTGRPDAPASGPDHAADGRKVDGDDPPADGDGLTGSAQVDAQDGTGGPVQASLPEDVRDDVGEVLIGTTGRPLPVHVVRPWVMQWGRGDMISVLLLVAMAGLLALAPMLGGLTWAEIGRAVLEEMNPLPPS
ncbi:MAG: hypothetical protein EA398_16900 [Deltaproteobacteria bacterium]|nr:MAG: hypothetical protein EA398_16900 [Deltaproteobacteria bacterium]